MGEETREKRTDRQLRWLADAYEQAQANRIRTGEQVRAVLQGRDDTWDVGQEWFDTEVDPDRVLSDIVSEETVGPVPILGRTYRRFAKEERELQTEMLAALRVHPAFPWLDKVKGIGGTLGCKLLARLDVRRADTPSAFAAYCGLGTVPGGRWKCPTCGKERVWPEGTNVTGSHTALGSSKKCPDSMALVEDGVRAAMPRGYTTTIVGEDGEKKKIRAYDAYAKKIMYLIGTSFLKARGAYADFYHEARAKLERERPFWADAGKHHTALRKTEKLFLCHLWLVWREALGLPTTEPYAHAILGHETEPIRPEEMVG